MTASPALNMFDFIDYAPQPSSHVETPIKLCLFDLDQTLLRTDDLEGFRGARGVGVSDAAYTDSLRKHFGLRDDRRLYSSELLAALRSRFPSMKWGVFTSAPRHYADTLLALAFPEFQWHCVVAHENVQRPKPAGDGILEAMKACGVQERAEVVLVGDRRADVLAGYHGECWTVLDKHGWAHPGAKEHIPALELVPDACINDPWKLLVCLADPRQTLPELEHRISSDFDTPIRPEPRFDRLFHEHPDRKSRVLITVLGRYFTGGTAYPHPLGGQHALTQQIRMHKNADRFPEDWIQAIRAYLAQACRDADPLVTVIPFKPKRTPRLEALLEQVRLSDEALPIRLGTRYDFEPDILSFSADAISTHKNSLGKYQRFMKAADTLRVCRPEKVVGRELIVFDDVVTTGATLFMAHRALKQAGVPKVCCMALAKSVSRVRH